MELLLDYRDEHVNRHGDPYLRLHRVLRAPVEPLDPQVLLDSLEEELHLPPVFVKGRDGQCRKREAVSYKLNILPVSVSLKRMRRMVQPNIIPVRRNCLVNFRDSDGLKWI
jgi:hypothetical protein